MQRQPAIHAAFVAHALSAEKAAVFIYKDKAQFG